jgi:hypothetical protein
MKTLALSLVAGAMLAASHTAASAQSIDFNSMLPNPDFPKQDAQSAPKATKKLLREAASERPFLFRAFFLQGKAAERAAAE